MPTNKQSAIWGSFWQIVNLSIKLIIDYEGIVSDQELTRKFPQMETAYSDAIIVHVAKIFSNSKNESFRLGKFKTICRTEIKTEIEDVENEYKDIIGKIVTNRNKLVAHLDREFYNLPFSKNSIERMRQSMAQYLNIDLQEAQAIFGSMTTTTDKSKERYAIGDLGDDLPRIKEMLTKLDSIWSRSIPFIESA